MAKDSRTYIRVHDGMPDHPKIEPLSDKAFRLMVTTWCWCSRHTTDGVVKADVWSKRGTKKTREELIASGVVEQLEGGDVLMHDYLDHQRSKVEIDAHRDQARANGSKGGRPPKSTTQTKPSSVPVGLADQNPTGNPNGTQTKTKTKPLSVSDTEPKGSAHSDDTETATQRVQRVARTYTDRVKLCNFMAVCGVVKTALGENEERHVIGALNDLADDERPVTAASMLLALKRHKPQRQRINNVMDVPIRQLAL